MNDAEWLADAVDANLKAYRDQGVKFMDGAREAAIEAATGLSHYEAAHAIMEALEDHIKGMETVH